MLNNEERGRKRSYEIESKEKEKKFSKFDKNLTKKKEKKKEKNILLVLHFLF